MYDVIVSGAGPSGSKCAEVIAKSGYKVALIEKDINYRKPCGGGLPSASMYKYYPQLRKLNTFKKTTIALFSANNNMIETTIDDADTNPIVIDRLEFDNLMRNAAVDAGAELFDKNVKQPVKNNPDMLNKEYWE